MDLFTQLDADLQDLAARGLRRRRRTADTPCAPRVTVDGHPMLAFCSNDYLGLAAHPQIVAALQEGAERYGAGSGASHLISGHTRAHAQLEERLADWMQPHIPDAQALYFCTGYMANLAILSAFADRGSALFSEELNHASLIDGTRLSRASTHIYPHRDLAVLENLLAASTAKRKLVVTDSVFSMDGDIAPLPQLLALCERHGAWLMMDDAHGFGVLGKHGHGALEHFVLNSPNVIYMGTLGKAAGVGGAFVAAHAKMIDWLVQRARPYIYTTAAPPALAHALLTALDIIEGEEGAQCRQALQDRICQLKTTLQPQRWQLAVSDTAIQPLIIGGNEAALQAAAALDAQHIWVPAIRPPTVPVNTARLRITLSAAHTEADVRQLVDALHTIEGDRA